MEEKKLYVIGIGPGAREQMTVRADRILRESQVVIGYTVYVDLVKEFYPQAEFLTTPMRQEKERCEMALKAAQDGRKTAMICSGDSGVYGMAGLVLQMAEAYPDVNVEVIPGVTAALGGGAILGAPLGHDFAVISLSDLLTPMEVIEKRLRAAAEADFIICLYNPSSRKRHDYLERACRILLEYKDPTKSVEFNDNRIAVFIAQQGNCYITNRRHSPTDMVCIYKNITETDRDKYQNLVFVEIPISKAILTESVQQAKMWLMNYGLSSQQKKKLNKIRANYGYQAIK